MSCGVQIFFNTKAATDLQEFSDDWVDLQVNEGFDDDRNLIFSNYSWELSLWKLRSWGADTHSHQFVNAFRSVQKHIDYTVPPMFVFDVQQLIGYIEADGVLRTDSFENTSGGSTLDKILELLSKPEQDF